MVDSVHLHWIRITFGETGSVTGHPVLGSYRCPKVIGVGAVSPTSPWDGGGSGDPRNTVMKCLLSIRSHLLCSSYVLMLISLLPSFSVSPLLLLASPHFSRSAPRFHDGFQSLNPDPGPTTLREPELRGECSQRDTGRLHWSSRAPTPLIHG